MNEKRLDFSNLGWEYSPLGSRFKAFESQGKKIRLVEISKADQHPDWCQTGHIGFVVSGELEIEFADEVLKFVAGDGIFIASGEVSKHRPKAISKDVLLFLVDEN